MPPSAARRAAKRAPKRSARPLPPYLRLVEAPAQEPVAPARHAEVSVSWGSYPLRVAHLGAGERFVVDDTLPDGVLGVVAPLDELEVEGGDLLVWREGVPHARVPPSTRHPWFTLDGGRTHGRSDALRTGVVRQDVDGALLFPLQRGQRCRFDLGPLSVEVAAIERPWAPSPQPTWSRFAWIVLGVSLVLNAVVLFALLRG